MDLIALGRFLILLSILIFVHETGHFLMARIFGVKIEEFGFGLPPRVFGKRVKGTIYSLNLLPIGGFVRLKGEAGESLGFGGADSFAVQSKFKRVLIVGAGVLGNFGLAWLIFSVLFNFGVREPAGKVLVREVAVGSPAAAAMILPGDFVLSIAGEPTETADELLRLTKERLDQPVELRIEQHGSPVTVTVVPRSAPPEGEGPLGISITTAFTTRAVPFWQTPLLGFREAARGVWGMLRGLGETVVHLFRGETVQVGGPVAIYAYSRDYAEGGLFPFLNFMALLSLNLAVVNLLPIPALDGGRILFIGVEALRRKKLSPQAEAAINSVGLALLIGLVVLLSIRDLRIYF